MTERKGIVSQNTYALSSEIQAAIYNSGINTSVAYDGMELLLSTGTVDGTIRIYGYRNS
jgi:hypothetical protein